VRLFLIAVTALLALGTCSKVDTVNVLDQDTGTRAVYATTTCVVGNPDGVRCDKKECKADKDSDCQKFAEGCLKYGNHYSGTSDAGTCSRVY
jgi:hypothetical protein